jgi:hypothetical protein
MFEGLIKQLAKNEFFSLDLPGKIWKEYGTSPNAYIPPADLSVFIIGNSKEERYKKKAVKVLFTFSTPQLISFEKTPEFRFGENHFETLQPSKLYIYRTTNSVTSLSQQIFDNSFLYKVLDLDNGENSYYEELDPNTEYYYFFVASDTPPSLSKLKIIENSPITNFQNRSGVRFYTMGSFINKIKLNKDGKFYYLERSSFLDIEEKEKSYSRIFREKMFITPNNEAFNIGETGFVQNNPYIKVRVTSKKTNKKIDLNLQYTETQKSEKANPKFNK